MSNIPYRIRRTLMHGLWCMKLHAKGNEYQLASDAEKWLRMDADNEEELTSDVLDRLRAAVEKAWEADDE